MPKKIDEETREILVSFVSEAYERLDDSEAQLSKLSDGDNTLIFNSVFRLFHSVKGSAGYLELNHIKTLTHEAETLLDVFLKEKIAVTPEALDAVYDTIDELRVLIKLVESEYTDEQGADRAQKQTLVLRKTIATLRGCDIPEEKQTPAPEPNLKQADPPPIIPEPPRPESDKITIDLPPPPATDETEPSIINEIFISTLVSRDMVQRFLGECADLVDRTEKTALSLDPKSSPTEAVHDMFRAIHTIKGNSGFFGYAYLESVCMQFESLLDSARKTAAPLGEAFTNTVMHRIDHIRSALRTVIIHEQDEEAPAASEPQEKEAAAQISVNQPVQNNPYKPLGEILVDMGAVQDETVQAALSEQERPLGEILLQKGIVNKSQIDEALKIQKAQNPAAEADASKDIVRKEIRVDTAKLDKLFELVGELITAESMVINNPDILGLKLDSFTKAFGSLNKISREIQETTMMIRMIPLDGLFQKMTRLVRDLSRKFDRPVNFQVSGQDTEMDKNVIEQISDPLVHILRNALDHGIESRERRLAAGKAENGSVHLDARYEGSEIWISVKDDGAGLNRAKIIAKAQSRGLLKADPETMSDKDVWAFIFEPGFSTAEVVSEVSGRGVGLDVVKKNLERIRGRIDIKSVPGEGTEFILAIPLTMAIIDGITVRAGKNRYSLPLNDIIEFFKVVPAQISHTERGEETVNIRTEFIPLIKFCEVFKIPDAVSDPCEGIVIIVQNNGRKAALLIDEVIGNQQIVVKSLSEYLGKVEGISGCSILGDGGVSFIIDTGKLLSMRLE